MSAAKKTLDHKLLRSLTPLCDLTPDMLTELSAKSRVDHVVSGATIFKAGERDHRTLYLIAGKLELIDASGKSSRLSAGSKQAQEPLDPAKPRSLTAVAKGAVTLLNIDTELLNMLLDWGGNASYQVQQLEGGEEEEETDWMSRFLQSKVFLKLRAENIQAMLMRMETVQMRAGHVVIREGDEDESYYIIAKGSVKVGRQHGPEGKPTKLATFTAGSGFGEEALIANSRRNATVIMQEDGELMKLAKDDFINLLVKPVLQHVTYEQAQAMQGEDVQWLDVRDAEEFAARHLPETINIPLPHLRPGLRKLNKLHRYIICSNQENRSSAAAFLLCQQGLDAYVLSEGLDAVPASSFAVREEAEKPAEAVKTSESGSANVVKLRAEPDQATDEEDSAEHQEALMEEARKRVQQEMQRAQAAENARQQAQEEVARLKAESEALQREREDAERSANQERMEALDRETAEREAAIQRAEAEAARAELAEAAQKEAEEEIARLQQETAQARREAEEHARQMAESAREEAENEIGRLKAEAEAARHEAEEQAKRAADMARSDAERTQAQKAAEESAKHQEEIIAALRKAEDEAERAQTAEQARREAEEEAQRMRVKAEETQREMEEQARLAADQARSEAEREAARIRAEELALKQAEIEEAVGKAEILAARAEAAEEEIERLKQQAEAARNEAEEQARLAVDQARSEVEREMARQRAEEMAALQAEREQTLQRAEAEADRARTAEEARIRAETEIQRLKVDAEVARMQLEEQAQRIADAARSEAEREAARAQAAEKARLQAEAELERLETQVETARLQAEEQARLAADQARTEAEREAARQRAAELAEQQAELEAVASRAEQEAARAQMADEARQRAEREIAKRQMEAEEAERRASEAEQARQEMEAEMARLREAASAKNEEAEKQAREVAERARAEAEEIRRNAEEEIQRLKKAAEAARMNSEVEVKRTIASVRGQMDVKQLQQRANMRARRAVAHTEERSSREREAREAALSSLGSDSQGLEEFLDPDLAAVDSLLDMDDLTSGSESENLLDPTQEQKPTSAPANLKGKWLSDDAVWEESLGGGHTTANPVEKERGIAGEMRDDSSLMTQVKPAPKVEMEKPSTFQAKEVDRNIRPQVVAPTGKPARPRRKGLMFAALLVVLVGGVSAWAMMQGQEQAMAQVQVVGNTLLQWKDGAMAQVQSWLGKNEQETDEEKLARLRERLEAIKAEAEAEKRKQAALEEARRKAQAEFAASQPVEPETAAEPEAKNAEEPVTQAPGFEQQLQDHLRSENRELSFEERLSDEAVDQPETLSGAAENEVVDAGSVSQSSEPAPDETPLVETAADEPVEIGDPAQ